jgi:hypothetical protein
LASILPRAFEIEKQMFAAVGEVDSQIALPKTRLDCTCVLFRHSNFRTAAETEQGFAALDAAVG